MPERNIPNIISQLKKVKEERDLKPAQILEMVNEDAEKSGTGNYLSEATIRRVFKENSEGVHFDYEHTIKPLVRVLLGMTEDDKFDPEHARMYFDQRNGLQDVVRFRNEEAKHHREHLKRLEQERAEQIRHLEEENTNRLKRAYEEYQDKVNEIRTLLKLCTSAHEKTISILEADNDFLKRTIESLLKSQEMDRQSKTNLYNEIKQLNKDIVTLKSYHKVEE